MYLIKNKCISAYNKIAIIVYSSILIVVLRTPFVLAAGPPPGVDSAVWCEQNADECAEWCADNVEAEICQEPECD